MSIFFSQVRALPEPNDDRLSSLARAPYFRDVLQVPLNQTELVASQLQFGIFNYLPSWVNALMGLRNHLVKRLGFEVGQTTMTPEADHWEVGTKAGFLTVKEISDNEVISGAEDKHMSFFISVKKTNNTVIVSTLVNQKTFLGRVYVNAILPFHYVIARVVINNAVKAGRI
ncbi:DUF2867 domain-containing protein [Marinomonas piezotolerans]|uniref:DUF2867 domain-containing protein n=1 Tax=Marinomonas piezotolerans TaxID=2213058 RepID=UPI001FE7B4B5|nr:DUF2867 domain-containing protein [Marinomonas piezotolerans]